MQYNAGHWERKNVVVAKVEIKRLVWNPWENPASTIVREKGYCLKSILDKLYNLQFLSAK